MIRLIASFLVAYTAMGDAPKPRQLHGLYASRASRAAAMDAPVMIAQAAPRAASSLRIIAPDSVPSRSGFAIQVEAQNVKGLFWLVFPISAEAQLVRIPSFPDGEVNPLIYLGGLDSGELNFVSAGVTTDGKAIAASKTVRVGAGPIPPGPTPPGPTPPGPTPPGPTPPPDPTPTYGLQSKVKGWVEAINDPKRAEHAQLMASQVDGIVNQIGAGTMTTYQQLWDALVSISKTPESFPGISMGPRWKAGLMGPLVATTAELFPDEDEQGNKITHPMKNYAQALAEVAAGLRSVQ